MAQINGRQLLRDIVDHGYSKKSLAAAINRVFPGEHVSEKCLQRAASPRHDEHHLSEKRLMMVCTVLGTSPDRYAVDEPVQIFTRHCSRERFRAYQAIVGAIDDNRVPERCWDYYQEDGECFLEHVLQNPKPYSTCPRISRNDWEGAFVDCKFRDIVMKRSDGTYRIVGARGEEMIEIIEDRTELEVRAARKACTLGKVERWLILQEMDQVILDCQGMLKEDHPPKAIIESEAQFHLTWAGRRGAKRRLLHYVLEVCKQLGDRLLRLDNNDEIIIKPNYAGEFSAMVRELEEMRNAFDKPTPNADEIEQLIRKHTQRSERLTRNNPVWFNGRRLNKFTGRED